MRIGMIGPVSHSYPPTGYGPWERVCHDLTERLVEMGNEVTLFSTRDSQTSAHLVPTAVKPMSHLPVGRRRAAEDRHVRSALSIVRQGGFDVVHSHLHVHVLVRAGDLNCPILTTLHGSAWNTDHHPMLRRHSQ